MLPADWRLADLRPIDQPRADQAEILCLFQRDFVGAAAAHHAEPGRNIGSQGRAGRR